LQSIAEFKAESERRRKTRERESRPQSAVPEPVKLGAVRRLFGVIATNLILIGMVLELAWIDAWLAEVYQPDWGNKSGGMGLVMIGYFMIIAVEPATFVLSLITLFVVVVPSWGRRWARAGAVLCLSAMVLSVSSYLIMGIKNFPSDFLQAVLKRHYTSRAYGAFKPGPKPKPDEGIVGTPAQMRTAGAEWALSNSITDESRCAEARSKDFEEACRLTVRRWR
jgi:hypothetical protein